ncbi:MAG: phosphoglycerate dehydrogenase [bacterium]|nr:MAG: phosphoglycerate dehydrogenase [bacterium]
MKVLVSDKLSDAGVEILKRAPGLSVDVKTGLAPEELKKIIGEYDALAIRSATKVTADIIEAASRLKVVGRAGIGVDNVDIPAATKKGIVVMNTPGGNTVTTAEHAIAMMCALARKIPQADASMKAGRWEKKIYMGVELMNKTLGIIGIGNIGSIVADRAQGLKMQVIAYDPYISEKAAERMGVELVGLDDLFKRSDFISIHVPRTEETQNLLNMEAFKKMKPGVRIINAARGGIVNEADMAEALKKGLVAGAAFDVFSKEPTESGNPLLELDNVILTPHLGASTDEAQENVAIAVAHQIADYLVKGTITNAVNVPSVSGDLLPKVQPYLELAEKLGSLTSQLARFAPKTVQVRYAGSVQDLPLEPMTISVLKGVMEPVLGQGAVNFVNASVLAQDRGLKFNEVKSSKAEDYSNLIEVTLSANGKEMSAAGFIFEGREPRIIRIDRFFMEARPQGNVLVLSNEDRPGVIGNLGSTLGALGINIASMQIGRDKPGGEALSFIQVDSEPGEEVIKALSKLPHIKTVTRVKF